MQLRTYGVLRVMLLLICVGASGCHFADKHKLVDPYQVVKIGMGATEAEKIMEKNGYACRREEDSSVNVHGKTELHHVNYIFCRKHRGRFLVEDVHTVVLVFDEKESVYEIIEDIGYIGM